VAQYDSADLLARTKLLAKRKAMVSDEDVTDTDWYIYLEEAQTEWMVTLASLIPEPNYTLEQMTTADGGFTYTFAGGAEPIGGHLELRSGRNGALLVPSTDWGNGDFVMEGNLIRIPAGRSRQFSNGLWARYVKAPGLLTAGVQPVLKPAWCRKLLPPRACIKWALAGGLRDPAPFKMEEQRVWGGDPDLLGDTGVLGALKTQYAFSGVQAVQAYNAPDWWNGNPDLT
jgi:hypothetical protein